MRFITLRELLRVPPWTPGVNTALRRSIDNNPGLAAVSVESTDGRPKAVAWTEVPEEWPEGTVYAWLRAEDDPPAQSIPPRAEPRTVPCCAYCNQPIRSPSPAPSGA